MLSRGRRPDVVSYTTLVNGYVRIGQLDDAHKVFDEMSQLGISPNSLTLSILIKGVFRKRRVEEGKELMVKLWAKMREEKNEHPSVKNAAFANLIDSLCREGFFHEVFRIAEAMPQGILVNEEFAYGQMIDSLCRAGRHHGASRIVYIMRKRGFFPSLVSYNSIVHGLSKRKGCMRAYQLFKEGIEFGYLLPEPTYKVLVESLCRERDLNKAKDVTEFTLGISGADKTKVYNIFLSALRFVDSPSEQLNVLISMLRKQCKPDIVTLNTIIHGFCKIRKVTEAKKILNDMLDGKFCAPDVVTFTTVIGGLLDVGKTEEALHLLNRVMPDCSCSPNVVTYNVVLFGLCKLKKACEAMEIFKHMEGKGISPDSTTYTAIIEGLCEVGQLEEAKGFWDDVIWPSKIHDDYVYAAILRGLCRLEKFEAACDFLYELVDCGICPGIVNYNILIDAACMVGLKKEAYQLLGEMRKNGLKPDAVTWRILGKLHGKKTKMHVDGNRCLETENQVSVEGELENNTGKIVDHEVDDYDENKKHGEPLEGLVDSCFSTGSLEDIINEEPTVTRKVDLDPKKEESPKVNKKEPLSRIARRVFEIL
ncbi:uncharacterized protein A4U43_C02F7960 [Asparagus officinalis]|uniref:Pentacotripeptide-repeat region of PRORP domain-containing protein n=2 Tax=Asparagus officinalis TaxID=4686 RepID=A0A5P1FGY2_ASPOF|nr:uncharacterized protein A4U43_C02F7960 [Asparagus officinalis]